MDRSSIRIKNASWLAGLAFLLLVAQPVRPQTSGMPAAAETGVLESAVRMTLGPSRKTAQYDYIMTGRIGRWFLSKGFDDVGGGYIRRGVNLADHSVRLIQVLFGSDPAKAPRGINNWGAATEAIADGSEAIFGFMKSINPESADSAQADIQKQKSQGRYAFITIVAFVDDGRAVSRSVPLFSNVDFNLHQLEQAQQLVVGHLSEDRSVRRLDSPQRLCAASRGFLKAVEELIDQTLAGAPGPTSRCYVYNARNYTVGLTRRSIVASKEIQVKRKNGTTLKSAYRNLVRAEFSVLNHKSEESTFELLLGADGALKGVPVQIVHRPNFWFEVELNLDSADGAQSMASLKP
jgi:hypothetical protein